MKRFSVLVLCIALLAAATVTYAQTPQPHFAYTANLGSNNISGYTIDPTTGALTPVPGSPFAAGVGPVNVGPISVTVDPTGRFAYVPNLIGSISAYAIDATTGALTPIAGSPFPVLAGTRPITVTMHPTGKFLYATLFTPSFGAVAGFAIDASSGALTPIPGSPFAVGSELSPLTLDPTGKFAYLQEVIPSNTSVLGFAIDSTTGTLSPVPGSPFPGGSFFAITVDPTGKFAYDPGSGAVSAFAINPTTGSLTQVPGSPFPAPLAISVTLDPTARFAYVVDNSCGSPPDGFVTAFNIDASSGALAQISSFPAGFCPQSMTMHPTGHFAYVVDLGAITGYALDATTGVLTAVPGSPFPGGVDTSLTMDPSGQFLYMANRGSNNVLAYSINATTGVLTAVPGSPFLAGTNPQSVTITPRGFIGSRTLRVPQDFPTVQAAVAASVAGDIILVSPGLYVIPGTPFTLANGTTVNVGLALHDGTTLVGSGPAQTVLDFSGAQIGILLQNGTAAAKLFHLQNASTAVFAYRGSNLTATNILITSSNLGMELNQGNSYTVINTTIDGIHDTTQTGSGIDVPFGGVANIQNNLVTNSDRGFTAGSFSFGTYTFNDVFGSRVLDWGVCSAAGCSAGTPPPNNFSFNPLYCPDLTLKPGSPARNAGNPAILNPDGTRSDMGAFGGPEAILPPTTCGGVIVPPIPGPTPPPANNGSATSGGAQQATANEPISTGNGNYYYSHVDFVIPGRGMPLVFQRSYNSLDNYAGPLGNNWTHAFNIILTGDADGTIHIRWGDGHGETFTPSGSGYLKQPGVFSTLVRNSDSTFILTQKDQSQFAFSSTGRLTTIHDRNGNTIQLAYDAGGNLTQVTDTVGRVLTLAYDAFNRITQATDPATRTVSFQYSSANDLVKATDAAGSTTQFAYDANHRVTSIIQPNGSTLLQNTYDLAGRVVTQTNGRGATTAITYDIPNVGDRTIADARGNHTIHTYDLALRIIKVTDAFSSITSFTYDANNDRTSVTDPNGETSAFAYDPQGNITGISDPLDGTTGFAYDLKNNLLMATNAKGSTTSFSYDGRGNLVSIHDALGGMTAFNYDSFGELTSKTDARGNPTTFAYNSVGSLVRIADVLGATTNLSYDAIGRLVSITDPNAHTATAAYDALSRLVKIADPLGNQTRFAYDTVGNLLKITDAKGSVTTYAYDATNNLVSVTDALGGITQYAYDGNNNRVSFANAKGRVTSYGYDPLNRLTAVNDPLGFATAYAYDPAGNVVSTRDANGTTNQFAYDALNRLLAIAYGDGKTVSFTHDPDGNRTSMADAHGVTTYSYDALDRLISVAHPGGKVVAYGYDATGNRVSLSYPDGKLSTYAYDALNRLATVTDWLARPTNYTYDATSNLTQILYPNNTSIGFSYDVANRLTKVVNSALGLPLLTLGYTLDQVGNRTALSVNGLKTNFAYDALNELLSAQLGPLKSAWTYDTVGNRLKETSPFGTTLYSYDAADRMLSTGSTTFSYDANGNRISKRTPRGTMNYSYDAANRLTAALGLGTNSSFDYDGDGNRTAQGTIGGSYAYVNDVATALPVVLNEQGPDGDITYAYGLGLIEEASPTFNYFYHYDGLGSTIALTDAAGKPRAAYAYDAWGNALLPVLDGVGTKNKFHFTGEALDPGTGLYYLRARYYDASVGRFASRDPLAGFSYEPLSLNRFAYVSNDPLDFVDPAGLCVLCKPTLLGLARFAGGVGEIFVGGATITGTSGVAAVPGTLLIAHGGYTAASGFAEFAAGLANKPIHVPSPAGIIASALTSDPDKIAAAEAGESIALAVFSPAQVGVPTAVLGLKAVGAIGKITDLLGKLSINTAFAPSAPNGILVPGTNTPGKRCLDCQ